MPRSPPTTSSLRRDWRSEAPSRQPRNPPRGRVPPLERSDLAVLGLEEAVDAERGESDRDNRQQDPAERLAGQLAQRAVKTPRLVRVMGHTGLDQQRADDPERDT